MYCFWSPPPKGIQLATTPLSQDIEGSCNASDGAKKNGDAQQKWEKAQSKQSPSVKHRLERHFSRYD
jgi:hypothetical protein